MANYPKCPQCGATGSIGSDQPPCACVIEGERLTTPPQPDQFEHESPLRAFTDWNQAGDYAIGKGLRPSAQHLPVYLDAIERKEGWQLMQMLLDDHGAFRSAIFRRVEPAPAPAPAIDLPNVTSREQAERVATFDDPSDWWKGELNGQLAFATYKMNDTFERFPYIRPTDEEIAAVRHPDLPDVRDFPNVTSRDQAERLREDIANPDRTTTPMVLRCPDCNRQILESDQLGWGFIAKCGRRLARIEDCGVNGCDTHEHRDYGDEDPLSRDNLRPGTKIGKVAGLDPTVERKLMTEAEANSHLAAFRRAYSLPLDYPRCGVMADDPINPRYYGGTACAEIGERLTGNCYMVLKYIWRLGEKDDPLIELGKAIWYAEREMMLGLPRSRGHTSLPGMKHDFVLTRTKDSPWRSEIACILWDLCYGFGTPLHWADTMHDLISRLEAKKAEMTPVMNDRGRGLEP